MKTTKTNAPATATANLALAVELDLADGLYQVVSIHRDGARCWDGRSYLTEAKAREAANRIYLHFRAAERAA